MPPFRIAVISGLVIDLVSVTDRIPDGGETITSLSFSTHPGGKGANSAVAASRLSHAKPEVRHILSVPNAVSEDLSESAPEDLSEGAPESLPEDDIQVRMVGAVGDDEFGPLLISNLAENHVDVSGVRTAAGQKTGVAVIIVETASGENRILFNPGANHNLLPTDFLTLESLAGGIRPDLLILQLEMRLDTVEQILATASREGINVLLNPAPAQCLPSSAYRMITHLVVNESEAATLLSWRELGELTTENVGWGGVTDEFLRMGVKNVVVTLGGKGAYFSNSPGSGGLVDAEKDVSVVDSTGAGDTFVGAYAVEVAKQRTSGNFNIQRAVQFACRAAARTVEQIGAQEAIPWAEEITPFTE